MLILACKQTITQLAVCQAKWGNSVKGDYSVNKREQNKSDYSLFSCIAAMQQNQMKKHAEEEMLKVSFLPDAHLN